MKTSIQFHICWGFLKFQEHSKGLNCDDLTCVSCSKKNFMNIWSHVKNIFQNLIHKNEYLSNFISRRLKQNSRIAYIKFFNLLDFLNYYLLLIFRTKIWTWYFFRLKSLKYFISSRTEDLSYVLAGGYLQVFLEKQWIVRD